MNNFDVMGATLQKLVAGAVTPARRWVYFKMVRLSLKAWRRKTWADRLVNWIIAQEKPVEGVYYKRQLRARVWYKVMFSLGYKQDFTSTGKTATQVAATAQGDPWA